MTLRHCLGCGAVQWAWTCRACRGEPDRRPWLLRPGWVQEVVVLLAAPWPWLCVRRRQRVQW